MRVIFPFVSFLLFVAHLNKIYSLKSGVGNCMCKRSIISTTGLPGFAEPVESE